jgi:hypothetical protein
MTPTDTPKVLSREFPKVKYQGTAPDAKSVTVTSAEEEAALGEGWIDGHEYWTAQRQRNEAVDPAEPSAGDAEPTTEADPELAWPAKESDTPVPAEAQATSENELPPATPIDEPRPEKKGKRK